MQRKNQHTQASQDDDSVLDEPRERLEALFEKVDAYIRLNIEIIRLKAVSLIAKSLSAMLYRLLLVVAFFLFFMLLNIGIAQYLGEKMESPYLGFLSLSGFYLLLMGLLFLVRKRLGKNTISQTLIDQFTKEDEQ